MQGYSVAKGHAVAFAQDTGVAERLAQWGDFVREHIGWLEADTFGDPLFDGRLALRESRGLKVCSINATRHRVVRTPGLIRRDDRGYVKIVAQLAGTARFEQGGRSLIITPGEWSIYDTTQAYVVSNPARIQQAAILLPRAELTRLGIDLGHLAVRRFSRAAPASRVVYDLLVEAHGALQGQGALAEDFGPALADHIYRAALEQDGVHTDASLRAQLKQRVMAHIAANLDNPDLSIDGLAATFGCSKRYLHKLFEGMPETLSDLIWLRRLERARRDLSDPGQSHRTITDIAFSWGFNSSSHFSRLFHDRFGVAPRMFKAVAEGRHDV